MKRQAVERKVVICFASALLCAAGCAAKLSKQGGPAAQIGSDGGVLPDQRSSVGSPIGRRDGGSLAVDGGTNYRPPGDAGAAPDSGSVTPPPVTTGDTFTFFVTGDPKMSSRYATTIGSMKKLDPNAALVYVSGDLTSNSTKSEWDQHMQYVQQGGQGWLHSEISAPQAGKTMYIMAVGNHDASDSAWLSNLNTVFPNLKSLGPNSESGVFTALRYKNALFIGLDSEHPSQAQVTWLKDTLEKYKNDSSLVWRFVFYHHPVYPCGGGKSPFDEGVNWVRLFEQYKVNIVFEGHTHYYTATKPLLGGKAVSSGGVRFVNASAGGSSSRSVDTSVTDKAGGDSYACGDILQDAQGDWNHYCHAAVTGTQLTFRCFSHDQTSSPKYEYVWSAN
ncbi:MAG: metallophosphoesterase [Deltaproteobacteria bacterium]|nr:metallophosphoesterase [Deltaproteobacteria bacterium]